MRQVVRFQLAILLCVLLRATPSLARVERFGVFIASNQGKAHEQDLRFAEQDAKRLASTLNEIGGLPAENTVMLTGESAESVQRALIAINDRIRQITDEPNTEVLLLVYYSGHADALSLHLGNSELNLRLLERLVRSSAADFRILIVDACRAGNLTQVKGGSPAPRFDVAVDESLQGTGTIFLTSSSASEDSQESALLQGSFFTHYFRSGLLGPADSNGDGEVSVEEAYHYAYQHTLRASSRTLVGPQHPTYRYEFKGQGRVTLTRPHLTNSKRGIVSFPPGGSYLVFLKNDQGQVIAEVGATDRRRSVSLARGKYYVRGRMPNYLLEGFIQVEAAESVELNTSTLRRVDYARLARKGASELKTTHGPLAGHTFRSALQNSSTFCHGGFLGYSFVYEHLNLGSRLAFCRATFSNRYLDAIVDSYDASVRAAYAWDLPWLSIEGGASVGASLHHQEFSTLGVAPSRTTLGPHFAIDLGLQRDIWGGFYLLGEFGVESHLFSLQAPNGSSRLESSLAYRQRVGLGKWF